jgi:hypothetical protein
VTLYRALTYERPFSKGDPDSGEPARRWPQLVEDPAELDSRVPWPISVAIMSCLAPDPADRPAPAELAAELEQVLDALPKPRISKLKPRLGR